MLRKYRRESRGSKISSDFPPNRPFRKSDTTHPLGNRKSSNHEKRKVSRVHKGRLQFSIDVEEVSNAIYILNVSRLVHNVVCSTQFTIYRLTVLIQMCSVTTNVSSARL